jgi:branched-chain amino acid transport system permease protein
MFKTLTGCALMVALLALPYLLDAYAISSAARILAFGVLCMSVNLLTGQSGLPTLGQAAFFGVGAYAAALVARHGVVVGPSQILIAAAAALVVALLTGLLALRTRGVAFIMITLAVGEIFYSGATSLDSVTHGSDGIAGVPDVVPFWGMTPLKLDGLVYYYVLAVFLLVAGAMFVLVRSPLGLSLRGLRDNEPRMRAIGYNTNRLAMTTYCIAGVVAGVGGALQVSIQNFVSPDDLAFDMAALALFAVIIGGAGSMLGAWVGAAILLVIRDYLGAIFPGQGPLLMGLLFVVAVYLIPDGVVNLRLWRRPRRAAPEGAVA